MIYVPRVPSLRPFDDTIFQVDFVLFLLVIWLLGFTSHTLSFSVVTGHEVHIN